MTAEEAVTGEEVPGEEETTDDGIMTISDAPMTVAAGGVTVILDGTTDGIYEIIYTGPDGNVNYHATDAGIYYTVDCNKHWVEYTNGFPMQFAIYPGTEVEFRMNPGYGLTTDTGTIKKDDKQSVYLGEDAFFTKRYITVIAPTTGLMTANIASDESIVPQLVNFTFYIIISLMWS